MNPTPNTTAQANAATTNDTGMMIAIAVGVAIIVAAIIIAFMVINNKNKKD